MTACQIPPIWSLRHSYVLILINLFALSTVQGTCYNPYGGYWIGFYPCSTDPGIQSCCEVYEHCLSNYTCLGTYGYYQAPCTDPEYKAPACVQGECAGYKYGEYAYCGGDSFQCCNDHAPCQCSDAAGTSFTIPGAPLSTLAFMSPVGGTSAIGIPVTPAESTSSTNTISSTRSSSGPISTSTNSNPGYTTTSLQTASPISIIYPSITPFNGGPILTGLCDVPQFASLTTSGSILKYGQIGCQVNEPACCPFPVLGNSSNGLTKDYGVLSECPADYVTISGACCPSGWSIYSTLLGATTPCFTNLPLPLTAPTTPIPSTISPATATPTIFILDQVFTLKYSLQSPNNSLTPAVKAGIGLGVSITILIIIAILVLSFCRHSKNRQVSDLHHDAGITMGAANCGGVEASKLGFDTNQQQIGLEIQPAEPLRNFQLPPGYRETAYSSNLAADYKITIQDTSHSGREPVSQVPLRKPVGGGPSGTKTVS